MQDLVQDVLVPLITGIRRRIDGLFHRRFTDGQLSPPTAVGLPDGPFQHRVIPVQLASGPQSQEVPHIVADRLAEGVRLLPVGTPPLPIAAGNIPPGGSPQTPHHQGKTHKQRYQTRPGPKPGMIFRLYPDDAGGLFRSLYDLLDLGGHAVLQIRSGIMVRVVPFCIQFPTPP